MRELDDGHTSVEYPLNVDILGQDVLQQAGNHLEDTLSKSSVTAQPHLAQEIQVLLTFE